MTSAIQRGDIVDVSRLNGEYVYRGLGFSATQRRGFYVLSQNGGLVHRRDDADTMTLVRRFGRKAPRELFRLQALTDSAPRSPLTDRNVATLMTVLAHRT